MPDPEVPLFFHEGDLSPGRTIRLGPEEAEHAGQSLRLRTGDWLQLLDGTGRVSRARVLEARARRFDVQIVDTRVEPPPRGPEIWLAPAIVKGPRFDFIIEKGTELGVAGFIPVISRYTEVRPADGSGSKPDRWKRVAIAAMKQSQRVHLPAIAAPRPLDQVLGEEGFEAVWVADPGEVTRRPALAGEKTLLLVGPEGGWHESERDLFAKKGVSFISLGPNRLRAETAALTLLVVARLASGAMGVSDRSGTGSGIA